jgi:hypothetical protein
MGGAVMPHCMGTIQGTDELDLSRCVCAEADPVVTQSDLAFYTRHLLECLRDRRRLRQIDVITVTRVQRAAAFLKFATIVDLREHLGNIEEDCRNLLLREWPSAPKDER